MFLAFCWKELRCSVRGAAIFFLDGVHTYTPVGCTLAAMHSRGHDERRGDDRELHRDQSQYEGRKKKKYAPQSEAGMLLRTAPKRRAAVHIMNAQVSQYWHSLSWALFFIHLFFSSKQKSRPRLPQPHAWRCFCSETRNQRARSQYSSRGGKKKNPCEFIGWQNGAPY